MLVIFSGLFASLLTLRVVNAHRASAAAQADVVPAYGHSSSNDIR